MITVKKLTKSFNVEIDNIAPDKSISHRTAIFSLLSDKTSYVENYLLGEDTLNTLQIVEQLGATVKRDGGSVEITPPAKLQEPKDVLDCGNSGTAIRLFSGFLSGLDGFSVLTGDNSLRSRPMKRVTSPLREIGAKIDGRKGGNLAPLGIRGGALKPFDYKSDISSAQVKSAMILAALSSSGVSTYEEPHLSRDHTERMLNGMGADLRSLSDLKVEIHPLTKPLAPLNIRVPADPSSGFFFGLAASIVPNSRVLLKNVTLNPTRIEAFKVLQRMGAEVNFIEKEDIYEPIGDIEVKYKELNGVEVSENIPWLIDELPALAVAMAVANGKSVVKNSEELRVKESDRISTVVTNLQACGVSVREFPDGYEIDGGSIQKAKVESFGDHRLAMSFAIAGLLSGMEIENTECIQTSFPNFEELLLSLHS